MSVEKENENPYQSPKTASTKKRKEPKSETLAFILNFVLPGAGLLYLGKPIWAAINFGVVLLIGVLLAVVLPADVLEKGMRYISLGISGGSGGLALVIAKQQRQAWMDEWSRKR